MGRAMSIDVSILLYGSSFLRVSNGSLDSELALATRVMRESRRTGRLPSGLPFYLRSACRAQDTPALRTHALLSEIRYAPLRGADSLPQAMYGPPPDCKRKVRMRRNGLRQCIRPVGEAFASGHDVLRALLDLTSWTASNALPGDRLRAGRFDLFSHQFFCAQYRWET
jgi:hypothetical protein